MDGFGTQKRPLTEVKEEPHERECDYEMISTKEEISDEHGRSTSPTSPMGKLAISDHG